MNILVVDDDAIMCRLLERYLLPRSHKVAAVCSAKEGLKLFDSAPDPFNAVISDIVMPDMGGICFTLQLRYRAPSIPIILITGYQQRYADLFANDNHTYLCFKPLDFNKIEQILMRYKSSQYSDCFLD